MESNSKMMNDTNAANNKSSKNNQSSNPKEAGFSRSCIWLEGDYNQLMSLGLPEYLKQDQSSTFRRTETPSKKLSIKQSQTPGLATLKRQRTSVCSTLSSASFNQRKAGRNQTLAVNPETCRNTSAVNENIFDKLSFVYNNSSFEAEKTEFTKKDEIFDTEAPDQEDDRIGFAFEDFGETSEYEENNAKTHNELNSSQISNNDFVEELKSDSCQMKMESCISQVNERKSQVFIKLSKVIQDLNSEIRKDRKHQEFRDPENDEWTIIEGELEKRGSYRNSPNNSACCTKCYIF